MEQLSNLTIASLKASTLAKWMLEGFNQETVELLNFYFEFVNKYEGNEKIGRLSELLNLMPIEKLQTSWSQSFCVGQGCLPPEESVVKSGLSMQEYSDLARGWYQRFGKKSAVQVPPDHLGVQLYFLSFLLSNIEKGEQENKEKISLLTQQFIEERLAWVEEFREQFKQRAQDEDLTRILPFVELSADFVQETDELLKSENVLRN